MTVIQQLQELQTQDTTAARQAYFDIAHRAAVDTSEPTDAVVLVELLPILKKTEADFARDLANYELYLQAATNQGAHQVCGAAEFERLRAARDAANAAVIKAQEVFAAASGAFNVAWNLPFRAMDLAREVANAKQACGNLFPDFVPPPAAPTIINRMANDPGPRRVA